MTRVSESAIHTEPDDVGTRAPGPGCTRSGRSFRFAAAVLLGLVGLAVYAPLLAGDRPLLVHARLPGHIEAHRKRLARAFPYDIRHGLPGVDGHVDRALDELGELVDAMSAARLAERAREWRSLCAHGAEPSRRLAFLASVTSDLESAIATRRTLFPAAASLGTVEASVAGLLPAMLLAAGARRRRRRGRLAIAVGLGIGIPLLAAAAPTLPGLDSPATLAAVRQADPEAIVIRPPIPFGPDLNDPAARLLSPLAAGSSGGHHWLGTDDLGRDVTAMLVWGARTSLVVGVASVAILLALGILVGAAAGYFRGATDLVVSRVVEIFQAFPSLILILAAVAFLEPGLGIVILVIGCTRWTTAARLVRGEFLRLNGAEFVVAARALGFSAPRVIGRHILPAALPPVWVHAVFAVAAAVLVESSLAFLGLGDPSAVSWGQVIDRGRGCLGAWWVTVFPGTILFLTILALRVLGEGLRSKTGARTAS